LVYSRVVLRPAGPNGAGKSTLINILAGLVIKTSVKVVICGHDIDAHPRAAKRAIGVVPQELNIDPFFTPRELLEVQAGLYGVPTSKRRSDEILDLVELGDKANAYTRTLSGGMRRRLLVAKAMVHAPDVLVLDEPTRGVDHDLRRRLWVACASSTRGAPTVLLTTIPWKRPGAVRSHAITQSRARHRLRQHRRALHPHRRQGNGVTVDRDLAAVPAALSRFDPD
jgi:ABC-2 type transport system ATP-binding protein